MSKSNADPVTGQARERQPGSGSIYEQITGNEDARVCKDIPDAACQHTGVSGYRGGTECTSAGLYGTGSLRGVTSGWAALVLVTLFSLASGLCSVSVKDVPGKTVSKTRRGALMGYSTAAAGVVTLLIGAAVEFFGKQVPGTKIFMGFLLAAAGTWLPAIAVFTYIREEPGRPRAVAMPSWMHCKISHCLKPMARCASRPADYCQRTGRKPQRTCVRMHGGPLRSPRHGDRGNGGVAGMLADMYHTGTVIAQLGAVSLLAALYITRMPDVSG